MDTKALRQKILDLAIRGKLVPQDPSDEPASALLERIREQKRQMVREGKLNAKDIKNDTVIFVGEDNLHYEKFTDGSVKCIEDEIPFEVPSGWECIRLKEAWELISGRDLEPVKYNSDRKGIPYITGASNFSNAIIKIERWTESPEVISEHGDLLITCKGTVGEMAFNDFGSAHIARQIMAIRNRYNLNIDYLRLCLTSFIDSIKRSAKGLIPGISRDDILNLLLPIPPISEQNRIAKKADLLLQSVDNITASKDNITKQLEKVKSKILDLAIRGKLVPQDPNDEPASVLLERIRAEKEGFIKQGKIKRDNGEGVIFKGGDNSHYELVDKISANYSEKIDFDLPDGWACITLNEVGTVSSGKTPKSEQLCASGAIPYFKISDMNTIGNEIYLKYTDNYVDELYSGPIFSKGSIVFPKNGGALLTNKKRILKHDSAVDLNTGVFTPSSLLDKEFMFYLFSSIDFSKMHKGAVIPTVDSHAIGNLVYGLPPLPEQRRIVSAIESYFALLDKISENLA